MKKKLLIVSALICIFCSALIFVGCKETTTMEKIQQRVSIEQSALYSGQNDNMQVIFNTTTQEDLFIADGKVGKIVTINKLTLNPMGADMTTKQFTYSLEGEKGKLSGAFEKSKLGTNFVATIDSIEEIGALTKIVVTYDETPHEITLVNILADSINSTKALEIAYEAFKEKIDASIENKTFEREVYIKVVEDTLNEDSYYWFVSFIAAKDDYWSALIGFDGQLVNSKVHAPNARE